MKALAKIKPELGIWMIDHPKPEIKPNEVLIKLRHTAICGTDIHIYNWDEWAQKVIPIPLITGHEFMGEIVELGSQVQGFSLGDRVSGEGHLVCGRCRNCRMERQHLCPHTEGIGVTRQGCFAEYLALPAHNVFLIPDSISGRQAAIFDPFGNAVHTATSYDLLGQNVLITGAGPIGILAVAIAKHAGARNIVITDVNAYRLDLAMKMGASYAVNVNKEHLPSIMTHLGIHDGFDVGLEMSGNPTAFAMMIEAMAYGGGIALLGFLPQDMRVDWDQFIFKGLQMKAIYGREMFRTWYKMTALLESGLDIAPVITHHFPIDDYEKGFELMRSGQSGKIILDWE